jgi:heptosyltransferase-2
MTGVAVQQVSEAGLSILSRRPDPASDDMHERRAQREPIDPTRVLEGYTIFLDRDGTLNEDPGYLRSAADLKLLPGVGAALARLKSAGARLVVITNQSGVGRGYLTLKDLEAIHARLEGLLEQRDAALDAIYFCPHHPDAGCRCRKPATGMVDRAVSELQVDLRKAYLVGDHASDMQLAKAVGAKSILVTSTHVDQKVMAMLQGAGALPDLVAPSITEAAEWILKDAAHRPFSVIEGSASR